MKSTESCPICSANEVTLWMHKENFTLVKCSSCSLVFITRSLYKENPSAQYLNDETSPVAYYLLTAGIDKLNFHESLRKVEKLVHQGSILDIGANVGTFLYVARERGWQGTGVEPNPLAVAQATAKGLNVYRGYFDEDLVRRVRVGDPGKVFDVIHMGDVIEHVFDPLRLLNLAHALLDIKGFLIIVTPDIDTFFARRFQIKPKEHLVYFNRRSIIKALRLTGFEPIMVRRQARRRDIARISQGTTKLGALGGLIAKIAKIYPLGSILNALAGLLIQDELFVIAKKHEAT